MKQHFFILIILSKINANTILIYILSSVKFLMCNDYPQDVSSLAGDIVLALFTVLFVLLLEPNPHRIWHLRRVSTVLLTSRQQPFLTFPRPESNFCSDGSALSYVQLTASHRDGHSVLTHHGIAVVDVFSPVYMLEDSALYLGSVRLYRKCHWTMPGTEASQDRDHVFPVHQSHWHIVLTNMTTACPGLRSLRLEWLHDDTSLSEELRFCL